MATNLLTISSKSLADRVVTRLREAVIAGELLPGERLTEPALAERLGISRSPVREALLRLEAMGLARRRNNYSTCVWEPTEKDVDEIINLRLMLESHAATQIIDRLDEVDFVHLEDVVHEQERAIRDQAYLTLVLAEREFHEYPCRKTENSRLMEWWDRLMSQWEVLVVRRWHYDPAKVVP
jgi:DNA-binding GntR family transcriptional regulator